MDSLAARLELVFDFSFLGCCVESYLGIPMKLVLGQTAEHEGKYVMRRAIEIPADELKKLPAKQIKGILFHAYMQLLEVERDAEIAELNKLLTK